MCYFKAMPAGASCRAKRRAEYVLFEAEPIDPEAIVEADKRAVNRFYYAVLAAFFIVIAAVFAA
jgi:hypothetical protein